MGKFAMVQNTHTRMEKYCTWEKPQRCHIKSKKGRTPSKTGRVHTEDNPSEADIPTGQEFGYPLQIITNHTYTTAMTHTDMEGEIKHETNF